METKLYVVKNWCDAYEEVPGVFGKAFTSRKAAVDFMTADFDEFVESNEIDLEEAEFSLDETDGTANVDFCGCVHYWEVEEVALVN